MFSQSWLRHIKSRLFPLDKRRNTTIQIEYFRWHDIKGKPISRRRSHVIQSNSPLPTVAELSQYYKTPFLRDKVIGWAHKEKKERKEIIFVLFLKKLIDFFLFFFS